MIAIEVAGSRRPSRTDSDGRWGRGSRVARWRSSIAGSSRRAASARDERGRCRGTVPQSRRSPRWVREEPARRLPDALRVVVPQVVLPRPSSRRTHQRSADGVSTLRGPGHTTRSATRGVSVSGGHQRVVVQTTTEWVGRMRTAAGRLVRVHRPVGEPRASTGARHRPRAGPSARLHLVKGSASSTRSCSMPTGARTISDPSTSSRRTDLPRGARAAHPEWRDGFARPATARAVVAAPRGDRASRGRMDGRDRAGTRASGRQARRGRRSTDGPASAGRRAPPLPAITESNGSRDAYAVLGSMPTPSGRPVPGSARPAGRGDNARS